MIHQPVTKAEFRTGGEHATELFRAYNSLVRLLGPVMNKDKAQEMLDDILVRHHWAKKCLANPDYPYPNRILAGIDMDDMVVRIDRLRTLMANWSSFRDAAIEATALIAFCIARLPAPEQEIAEHPELVATIPADVIDEVQDEAEQTVPEEVPDEELALA